MDQTITLKETELSNKNGQATSTQSVLIFIEAYVNNLDRAVFLLVLINTSDVTQMEKKLLSEATLTNLHSIVLPWKFRRNKLNKS